MEQVVQKGPVGVVVLREDDEGGLGALAHNDNHIYFQEESRDSAASFWKKQVLSSSEGNTFGFAAKANRDVNALRGAHPNMLVQPRRDGGSLYGPSLRFNA